MRKPKKKNIGLKAPATRGDLEQLREDIHADIVEHTVSQQEFQETRDEANKRFDGVNKQLDGMEDQIVNRVVTIIQARDEQRSFGDSLN